MYADDTTVFSKCDLASDMWHQLEVDVELELDLQHTIHLAKKCLVDVKAGRTQLVSFEQSKKTGAIDVKKDGYIFEEKSSFKIFFLIGIYSMED